MILINGSQNIIIPAQNSASNISISDIIGNKLDDESGNSIYSKLYMLSKHAHGTPNVYPTLAAGKTATAAAGAWTLGNYLEVVPVNTITSPFDIHFVNIANASAADTYELVLYAATTEIGRIRTTRAVGDQAVNPVPFMCTMIPANTQIQAKVACSGGGNRTLTFSVFYHVY